jgi:hypothetical protein
LVSTGIIGGGEYAATHPNEIHRAAHAVSIEAQTLVANSNKASNIALGLREHLDKFAEAVGGSTHRIWGTGNFQSQFLQTINNSSNRISFNLDGIKNVWSSVSQGAGGIQNGVTNWELYTIYANPSVLQRTTFYLNGVEVANPFK